MKNDFTCGDIEKCDPEKTKHCPFCGSKEIVIDKYEHRAGERFRVFLYWMYGND